MRIVDRLEDTLNGGYQGVYNEVIGVDCYRLKKLNFVPDVIFDLGANIGCFARHAQSIFPDAKIISVEPDAENFIHLVKFTNNDANNITFINAAIGSGDTYMAKGIERGCHFRYINAEEVNENEYELADIESVMPHELIKKYTQHGQKFMVKMDIESNENLVFANSESMIALKEAEYLCFEVHVNAPQWTDKDRSNCVNALSSFSESHNIEFNQPEFFAYKK